VKNNGAYHDKYQSYLDRGMSKNKAWTAISRKRVRVLFAMARDQAEFNPNYEIQKASKKAA
jgi:hypothetical protein